MFYADHYKVKAEREIQVVQANRGTSPRVQGRTWRRGAAERGSESLRAKGGLKWTALDRAAERVRHN